MGFWKWLFGRKKQEEAQEEWEETVYERGKVNFNEAEERMRYLTGCLEQIGEAQKEMQLLNGEYAIVTSYLTDMEEIEALPPEHMAEIKGCAGKMQTLEADRRRYLDKERHLSEAEYRQMRSQENEIEEGIAKLQEAERYRKLVRQDLARLDGERHAYGYRKQELRTGLVNLKGMAVICLTCRPAIPRQWHIQTLPSFFRPARLQAALSDFCFSACRKSALQDISLNKRPVPDSDNQFPIPNHPQGQCSVRLRFGRLLSLSAAHFPHKSFHFPLSPCLCPHHAWKSLQAPNPPISCLLLSFCRCCR